MKLFVICLLLLQFLCCSLYADDNASEKAVIGKLSKWVVLMSHASGKKVCYAVNYSVKRVGNQKEKSGDKSYMMVHYISDVKKRVSFYFGYDVRHGSKVNVSIDGKQFELISYDQYAISDDIAVDEKMINAIVSAKKVLVRAESSKNTYSVDEFSVVDFGKVLAKMKSKCGTQQPAKDKK